MSGRAVGLANRQPDTTRTQAYGILTANASAIPFLNLLVLYGSVTRWAGYHSAAVLLPALSAPLPLCHNRSSLSLSLSLSLSMFLSLLQCLASIIVPVTVSKYFLDIMAPWAHSEFKNACEAPVEWKPQAT